MAQRDPYIAHIAERASRGDYRARGGVAITGRMEINELVAAAIRWANTDGDDTGETDDLVAKVEVIVGRLTGAKTPGGDRRQVDVENEIAVRLIAWAGRPSK